MQARHLGSSGREGEAIELDLCDSSQQLNTDSNLKSSSMQEKKQANIHPESKLLSTKPSRSRALLRFGWWWEFGAILVSLVSTTLMITILLAMNGKPLQHWKLPIQINSLIAIFSTFTRSSLLLVLAEGLSQLKWNHFEKQANTLGQLQVFDDASRGPWGALTFFYKAKRNVCGLAAIGAALTLLALTFDPFTQQILEFPSRKVSTMNGTAYIYTAEDFKLREWSPSTHQGGPKLALMRSILSLLPSPSSRIDSHIVCPTGDCEMPAHWSLAGCTACEDHLLHQDECFYSDDDNGVVYGLDLEAFKSLAKGYGSMEYSRKKFSFSCWPDDYDHSDPPAGAFLAAEPSDVWFIIAQPFDLGPGSWYDHDVTGDTDKHTSKHMITIESTGSSRGFPKYEELDQWPGQVPKMTRCKVNYCVKETAPTILRQGRVQDSNAHNEELPLTFSNACGAGMACSDITATFRRPDNQTRNIQINTELRLKFSIDVIEVLLGVFKTEMGKKYLTGLEAQEVAELTSTVISSFMRGSQNEKVTNLTGAAFSMETYVHVRWEWFILPTIIVLASVTFLIVIALKTHSKEQLFKSSVLIGYFLKWEQAQEAHGDDKVLFNRPIKKTGRQFNWRDLSENGAESRVQLIKKEEGEIVFI